MAKIAVTGSTGFVGGNIAAILHKYGHEVVGLVRREPESALPWSHALADFQSVESIAAAATGCDAIVHCAIANDFTKLMQDRPFAYDSYVGMTQRVTQAANQISAQTVYISTDWVMDGTTHLTPETDPGNPVNFYGVLKALGEQVIRDLAPETGAICRIAGVMGRHQTAESPRSQDVGFGYFVLSLVEALRAGNTFTVWGGERVNKFTTPSLAAEIGAQIERVILRRQSGTFHLVGDESTGRMELAELVCEVFELDALLLRESDPPEAELFPAAVPVDTSLGNAATKQRLGIAPQSLRQILEAFKEELASGEIKALTASER